MNPLDQVFSACREWKQLTAEEASAIHHGNWVLLNACHARKDDLRKKLEAIAFKNWPLFSQEGPARQDLTTIFEDLIGLERENARVITGRMQKVSEEIQLLSNQTRTLVKVRRSYGREQTGVWASYS